MIRVLVVEDSPLMAKLISSILESDHGISVAGIAGNGAQAVQMTGQLKPDLITMDINMPVMDGLEATKQIMSSCPTPILIISASVFKIREGVDRVIKAISYGALDVMEKAAFEGGKTEEHARNDLIQRVKLLSGVRVVRHLLAKVEEQSGRHIKRETPVVLPEKVKSQAPIKIIGFVSSTGGPEALLRILKGLPRNLPASVVIVQHIAPGFVGGLVDWLSREAPFRVKLAEEGELLRASTVYVAPSDLQMRVTKAGRIALTKEAMVGGLCPSGTVLLKSISEAYGSQGIGVVLTGMGRDGSDGLKAVHDTRGRTIAQNEESSIIFGMPKAAIDLGAVDEVLPLSEIAGKITNWVGS